MAYSGNIFEKIKYALPYLLGVFLLPVWLFSGVSTNILPPSKRALRRSLNETVV